MAQSLSGAWRALYAACQTLYGTDGSSTVVVVGDPGVYAADLIVSLLELRAPRTRPTAGPGRSRDMTAEVDVIFSKFVNGGDEAQQAAIDDAIAASDQLEAYLRTSPNEKLAGNCYDSWVSNVDARPYVVWVTDEGGGTVAAGRACDATATVTVRVRI